MYSQTYLVKTTGSECQGDKASRDAFFQCGNYCYSGEVKLDYQYVFGGVTLQDIPSLVPIVQGQQEDLSYLCNASNIPASSNFYGPLQEMEKARAFLVSEITSDSISSQMTKLKKKHPWIDDDDDDDRVYFELVGDTSSLFRDILFIASRVYAKGLVFVTIFFEGIVYCHLEDATGDQPLLDINFPGISGSGRGVTLAIYDGDGSGRSGPWMKLSVWQSQTDQDNESNNHTEYVEPIIDFSSDCYVQSYCILKSSASDGTSDVRDVMFRFGSWCYAGQVKLIPTLSLADIPYVIPAVRVQQNKLDFLSDISSLPASSPFACAMKDAVQKQQQMEALAVESGAYLSNLIASGEKNDVSNVRHWLGDDTSESFFEFSCYNDGTLALSNVELIATKSYNPNGIVSVSIYFGGNWYLFLNDGNDFPLMDSKFPDISQKSSTCLDIQSYPSGGINGWPQLRRVSIWRLGCDGDEFSVGEKSKAVSADREHDTSAPDGDQIETTSENRLEEKLEEIGNADDCETAWDIDGKPKQKDDEPNVSNNADGDDFSVEEKSNAVSDYVQLEMTSETNNSVQKPAVIQTGEADAHINADDSVASDQCDNSDDGDIYAQLDKLDHQLNRELRGLKEFGILRGS